MIVRIEKSYLNRSREGRGMEVLYETRAVDDPIELKVYLYQTFR